MNILPSIASAAVAAARDASCQMPNTESQLIGTAWPLNRAAREILRHMDIHATTSGEKRLVTMEDSNQTPGFYILRDAAADSLRKSATGRTG